MLSTLFQSCVKGYPPSFGRYSRVVLLSTFFLNLFSGQALAAPTPSVQLDLSVQRALQAVTDELPQRKVFIGIRKPVPVYDGWFIQYEREVFNEGFTRELYTAYNQAFGFAQDQRHTLSRPTNEARNKIIFNPYTSSYINLYDAERGFVDYMTKKISERALRTLLTRSALKNNSAVQQVQKIDSVVQKATNVRVVYQATPTSVPRSFGGRYDYISNRLEASYSGPEGTLGTSAYVSLESWEKVQPLAQYSKEFMRKNFVMVGYNIIGKGIGYTLGRRFKPTLSVSATYNATLPTIATAEKRGYVQLSYVF